jgi:sulfatase maturation enzyme AslB (radical SAM superfamily)
MQRIGFILKKAAAKHFVCAGDPVSASVMSNACSMMQEIADIINNNSLKLQETLDGPSTPSNYSNYINVDWA